MQTAFIIVGVVIAVAAIWLGSSAFWIQKQSLVGSWVASLPDGTHVTLKFDGERKGGLYKQLSKREGTGIREFGHWTISLLDLRLIIMASDVKQHPRFGVDTQYWVTWEGEDQLIIDGPDRPKWTLTRAANLVEMDFDSGSFGEPAPNGGPAATSNPGTSGGRHRRSER